MSFRTITNPAPANVRVLVRVRPLNDNEQEESNFHGRSAVLNIDSLTNGPTVIDFSGANETELPSGGGTVTINSYSSEAHSWMSPIGQLNEGIPLSPFDPSPSPRSGLPMCMSSGKQFTFDAVHGPKSTQTDIFESVKGIVDAIAAGYNGTIVAYGQTGSGKTHTIFGNDESEYIEKGLVQQSLHSLFRSIKMSNTSKDDHNELCLTTAKASFFEIFNERVYDLLSNDVDDTDLPVRVDAEKGVYLEGLAEEAVANTDEAEKVLFRGMQNRRVAATAMNRASSRSHAVFVLTLRSERTNKEGQSKVTTSKFTLVDLAGSERQKATAVGGARLKEASMINKSLLCLGYVINALVDRENGKERHVPFRDSKLTFLLRDSWGGNSKTCLVATVSPSTASMPETISTLKFAQRAKMIKNRAVLNENTTDTIVSLKSEVDRLRSELERRTLAKNATTMASSPSGKLSQASPGGSSRNLNIDLDSENFEDTIITVLTKKLTVATEKLNLMEKRLSTDTQLINSLKRELNEETMVRKFKQRRIDYLTKKRAKDAGSSDNNEEVEALTGEIDALRRQVENPSTEAVEWKVAYQRLQHQAEQRILKLQSKSQTLGGAERAKLEDTVAKLLRDKVSLNERVTELSNASIQMEGEISDLLHKVENIESHLISTQEKVRMEKEKSTISGEKLQKMITQQSELTNQYSTVVESLTAKLSTTEEALSSTQQKLAGIEKELQVQIQGHMAKLQSVQSKWEDKLVYEAQLREQLEEASRDNSVLIQKMEITSTTFSEQKRQLEVLAERFENIKDERDKTVTALTDRIAQLESDTAGYKERIELEENKSRDNELRAVAAEENIEVLKTTLENSTKNEVQMRGELALQSKSTNQLVSEVKVLTTSIAQAKAHVMNASSESSIENHESEINNDDLVIAMKRSNSELKSIEDAVSRLQDKLKRSKEEGSKLTVSRNEATRTVDGLNAEIQGLTRQMDEIVKEKTNAIGDAKTAYNEMESTYKSKILMLEEKHKSHSDDLVSLQNSAETQVEALQSSLNELRTLEASATFALKQKEETESCAKKEIVRLENEVKSLKAASTVFESRAIGATQVTKDKLHQTEKELVISQHLLEEANVAGKRLNEKVLELSTEKKNLVADLEKANMKIISQFEELSKATESIEAASIDAENRVNIAEENIRSLASKIMSVQNSESLLREELKQQRESKSQLEQAIQAIFSEVERTKTCAIESSPTKFPDNEVAKSETLSDLNTKLSNSQSELRFVQEVVRKLKSQLQRSQDKEYKLTSDHKSAIDLLEEQNSELQKWQEKMTKQLMQVEAENQVALENANRAHGATDMMYNGKIAAMGAENGALSLSMQTLRQSSETELKALQCTLDDIREQEEKAQLKLQTKEQVEDDLRKEVRRLNAELELVQRLADESLKRVNGEVANEGDNVSFARTKLERLEKERQSLSKEMLFFQKSSERQLKTIQSSLNEGQEADGVSPVMMIQNEETNSNTGMENLGTELNALSISSETFNVKLRELEAKLAETEARLAESKRFSDDAITAEEKLKERVGQLSCENEILTDRLDHVASDCKRHRQDVARLEEIVDQFESEKHMRASDVTPDTQELDKENTLIIVQNAAMSKVSDNTDVQAIQSELCKAQDKEVQMQNDLMVQETLAKKLFRDVERLTRELKQKESKDVNVKALISRQTEDQLNEAREKEARMRAELLEERDLAEKLVKEVEKLSKRLKKKDAKLKDVKSRLGESEQMSVSAMSTDASVQSRAFWDTREDAAWNPYSTQRSLHEVREAPSPSPSPSVEKQVAISYPWGDTRKKEPKTDYYEGESDSSGRSLLQISREAEAKRLEEKFMNRQSME